MSEQSNLQFCHTTLQKAGSAIGAVLDGASDELDLLSLSAQLDEVTSALDTENTPVESLRFELAVLKSDLAARIRCMTRAVGVAGDRSVAEDEMLTQKELEGAPAEELLRLYRRACGRFRDTFPGNTGYLSATSASRQDWSEYKSL